MSGKSTSVTSGKILSASDTDGNLVDYDYQAFGSGFLVKSLTSSASAAPNGMGDKVDFAWDASGNLQSVTSTGNGVVQQAVTYTYANNRLVAVNVAAAGSGQWADAATSAVGGGVGHAVGSEMGLNDPGFVDRGFADQFGARLVTGLAGGAASAGARGGRVAVQQVATDAFGNAFARAILASRHARACSESA